MPLTLWKSNRTYFLVTCLGALLIFCSIALILVDQRLSESRFKEIQLVRNIGEILRLDEVLTMSARYFASSHDQTYRDRYNRNVDLLDYTIKQTFQLSTSDEANRAVKETEDANNALVAMELESFDLANNGKWSEATSLLEGTEYTNQKAIYSAGMAQAFGLLASAAARRSGQLRLALMGLVAFLFLNLILVFGMIYKIQLNSIELEKRDSQYEALKVTMTTVMDTFGNALNNLLLFRVQAEESGHFSEADLKSFDSIVNNASQRLQAMGQMTEFKVRMSGTLPVLDFEHKGSKSK